MGCSFSWGCYNSCGLSEGLFLSQLVFNIHVFPLIIMVFGYLHQHMEGFFHRCANMAHGVKGTSKCLFISILCAFYK
jgi:hypothetical protein